MPGLRAFLRGAAIWTWSAYDVEHSEEDARWSQCFLPGTFLAGQLVVIHSSREGSQYRVMIMSAYRNLRGRQKIARAKSSAVSFRFRMNWQDGSEHLSITISDYASRDQEYFNLRVSQ